jgi:alpha-glucoside transport system permease protein
MAVSAAEIPEVPKVRKGRADDDGPLGGKSRWRSLAFLAPALIVLGAVVVYPAIDTIGQSFQNDDRTAIVGFENYGEVFSNDRSLTAFRNTLIWVVVAPSLITGFGLVFAVLSERVGYGKALKLILFMPVAISFVVTGAFWRLMYEQDPELGVINALVGAGYNTVNGPGPYPDATIVAANETVERSGDSGPVILKQELSPGDSGAIGLVGILEEAVPTEAQQAAQPEASSNSIGVVVWRDFKPGGGEIGQVEEGELGLPGTAVELVDSSGEVVASETTGSNGQVTFTDVGDGPFTAQVAASNFEKGFQGIRWLGSGLATLAIILAFVWATVGFAVVVIAAGLAALPRDLLEAARVDGATEWQVFRRITMPLLAPVIGVVFITQTIGALKVFDLVYVLAPNRPDSGVIALEMFRTAFTGGHYGIGAAIAVCLFLLVVPIMALNIRRLRREG